MHFGSKSSEWNTPPKILERVLQAIGAIDLDPCSNSHENPNVPAARHFTEDDGRLCHDWSSTVFMNPPYGWRIRPWITKLDQEYRDGRVTAAIALIPARPDPVWFRLLRDHHRCFIDGRPRFSGHANAAPFPSALVYLGPDLRRFAEAFGPIGDVYERVRV